MTHERRRQYEAAMRAREQQQLIHEHYLRMAGVAVIQQQQEQQQPEHKPPPTRPPPPLVRNGSAPHSLQSKAPKAYHNYQPYLHQHQHLSRLTPSTSSSQRYVQQQPQQQQQQQQQKNINPNYSQRLNYSNRDSQQQQQQKQPPPAHSSVPHQQLLEPKKEPEQRQETPEEPLDLGSKPKPSLFKVEEPSVLKDAAAEPSKITTVVNSSAVIIKAREEDEGKYVHKLKKAWIRSYHDGAEPSCSSESNPGSESTSPRPSNAATPSPAPSSSTVSSSASTTAMTKAKHPLKVALKKRKYSSEEEEVTVRVTRRNNTNPNPPMAAKREQRLRKAKLNAGSSRDVSPTDSEGSEFSSSGSVAKKTVAKRKRRRKNPNHRSEEDNSDLDEESNESKNPFNRPPLAELRKSGASFLQDTICRFDSLPKCRECRYVVQKTSSSSAEDIFCRFYGFRLLRFDAKGVLAAAGFSDPFKDPDAEAESVWSVEGCGGGGRRSDWDRRDAETVFRRLRGPFEALVKEEREAVKEFNGNKVDIAWKKAVTGISESCDVCECVLFNIHWECGKCGFVVCFTCYKVSHAFINAYSLKEAYSVSVIEYIYRVDSAYTGLPVRGSRL